MEESKATSILQASSIDITRKKTYSNEKKREFMIINNSSIFPKDFFDSSSKDLKRNIKSSENQQRPSIITDKDLNKCPSSNNILTFKNNLIKRNTPYSSQTPGQKKILNKNEFKHDNLTSLDSDVEKQTDYLNQINKANINELPITNLADDESVPNSIARFDISKSIVKSRSLSRDKDKSKDGKGKINSILSSKFAIILEEDEEKNKTLYDTKKKFFDYNLYQNSIKNKIKPNTSKGFNARLDKNNMDIREINNNANNSEINTKNNFNSNNRIVFPPLFHISNNNIKEDCTSLDIHDILKNNNFKVQAPKSSKNINKINKEYKELLIKNNIAKELNSNNINIDRAKQEVNHHYIKYSNNNSNRILSDKTNQYIFSNKKQKNNLRPISNVNYANPNVYIDNINNINSIKTKKNNNFYLKKNNQANNYDFNDFNNMYYERKFSPINCLDNREIQLNSAHAKYRNDKNKTLQNLIIKANNKNASTNTNSDLFGSNMERGYLKLKVKNNNENAIISNTSNLININNINKINNSRNASNNKLNNKIISKANKHLLPKLSINKNNDDLYQLKKK